MSDRLGEATDLVYRLDDRPGPIRSVLAALQHVMASVFAIAIVPIIIAHGLHLGADETAYLVSMTLIVAGVTSFIQTRRIGPVGTGLLTLQGTSFSFVATLIAGGLTIRAAGSDANDMMAAIFGTCLVGSLAPIILSRFITKIRRIITPTVTGVVTTVIGLSLISVGMSSMAGGAGAGDFGSLENLALGAVTIFVIVVGFAQRNPLARIAAILIGILVGTAIAAFVTSIDVGTLANHPVITVPTPLKYGFGFRLDLLLPVVILYVITSLETAGDVTANSVISGEPVKGPVYIKRIQGGILGDGVNSAIASVFNAFPNTTFAQNNGVIQLTGIASRHVALFIAPILILLGLFPVVGALFVLVPQPVIGGAMLLLFGSIAVAGIRLIASEPIDRNRILVMAVSFGLGMGTALVPDAFQELPSIARSVVNSPIALSGVSAILMTLVLPEPKQVTSRTE